MSSLSKVLVATLLFSAVPMVNSGIKDEAKSSKPTKVQSMARIPKKTSHSGTLSCWQEGRLIFQSKSISRESDLKNAALVLAAKGKSIQLMDFKNGLCILEQAGKKSKLSKK